MRPLPPLRPRALALTAACAVSLGLGAPASASAAVTPPPPCKDRAYSLSSSHWTKSFAWRFQASSIPSGITKTGAESALRRAVRNVTSSRNSCGLADRVDARARYLGRTNRRPNIHADAGCGTPDGRSVVGFGKLPPEDLALTCYWTRDHATVEADIVLNKDVYGWTVQIGTLCLAKWSVEAVATHEAGHVFGLGHVTETDHGNLTMSTLILPCQSSEATLGLGDVRGLRQKY